MILAGETRQSSGQRPFPRFLLSLTVCIIIIMAIGLPCLSRLADYRNSLPDLGSLPTAEVARVVDDETVELKFDGEETPAIYRLVGVDAPAFNDPGKPDEPYGKEADIFVRNLLKGETVWVEKSSVDVRGPSLVSLFRAPDGLFVNLEIVRQGYGVVDLENNFDRKQLFLDYQEFAKKAKKGRWAGENSDEEKEEGFVYIASSEKGKKYHKKDCSYIRYSSARISLDEAKRKGLGACSRCDPSE